MTDFFVNNAAIIVFMPFWTCLMVIFLTNTGLYTSKKVTTSLTLMSTLIGIVFSTGIMAHCITHSSFIAQYNWDWLKIGDVNLSIGCLIDNLSATMLLVVTIVSFLVQFYSYEYMHTDEGFHRFFAYLNLFNFSMLGLVLSTNLFQTYIFWELVGVSSYLLIGFWYKRSAASKAAIKAFLVNRIGDIGLLCGIIAFYFYSMSLWSGNNLVLDFTQIEEATKLATQASGNLVFTLIAFSMLIGAMAKSAQFPLHVWLPDAMEGPTPISALIHAATMVAAGVYLVARIYPILQSAPLVMNFMIFVGAITAIITAIIAMSQYDIKKVLAYSTCSQLGYMFMAMGIGAYSAGIFHLVTHAFFKAMLFLCAGAIIHSLSDQQDMRYMGGLRKKSPIVAICYLIGAFSISGLFLSGFYSKEAIFSGILAQDKYILLTIAIAVAGLTSFYMFRSYFMVFEGEYRGHSVFHRSSIVLTAPIVVFAVPSAILGYTLSHLDFLNFIHPLKTTESSLLSVVSVSISLAGFLVAWLVYGSKFAPKLASCFTGKFSALYELSLNKFYMDDFYNVIVENLFQPFAALLAFWDRYIVDGAVNLVAICTQCKGFFLSKVQTGVLGTYIAISIALTAFLMALLSLLWLYFNILRF